MVYAFMIVLSMSLVACISTEGPQVSHPKAPQEDLPYWQAHQKVTQNLDVINNFETKHQFSITHLSTDFRNQLMERYRSIFKDDKGVLSQDQNQSGFFVTVYSAKTNLQDLSNDKLWTLRLVLDQRQLAPARILNLDPKELWQPFFPAITPWSQEYLILFDVPPRELEAGVAFKLSMSSPDGGVTAMFR